MKFHRMISALCVLLVCVAAILTWTLTRQAFAGGGLPVEVTGIEVQLTQVDGSTDIIEACANIKTILPGTHTIQWYAKRIQDDDWTFIETDTFTGPRTLQLDLCTIAAHDSIGQLQHSIYGYDIRVTVYSEEYIGHAKVVRKDKAV